MIPTGLNSLSGSDVETKESEQDEPIQRIGTIIADPVKVSEAVFSPATNLQPPVEDELHWLIGRELSKVELKMFDWRQWADVAFLVVLTLIGFTLIGFSEDAFSISNIAELLINAGSVPFFLASWALLTGAATYRKFNAIKVCSGALLFVSGVVVLATSGEKWESIVGSVLIEIGAIFFISRLFFLTEDSEREIEKLRTQLKEARQATGAGLALSYFYNFLLPMSRDLTNLESKNDKQGEEKKYGKKLIKLTLNKEDKVNGVEEFLLQEAMMTIFVPRTLNKNDMKDALRGLGKEGCFKYYSGYRAMSVNFLKHWTASRKTDTEDEQSRKCVSGMCCMPTVISSIYRRWEEVESRRNAAKTREKREAILAIDIEQEVLDFQNCLISLINSDKTASQCLRVISMPPLPLTNDDDFLWHAIVAVNEGKVRTKGIDVHQKQRYNRVFSLQSIESK